MDANMLDASRKDDDGVALSNDVIWGVQAIASEIGRTRRQAYNLLETGKLPASKFGGRWVSSRSRLRAHFKALINGEVA
jgi:hypothetical protein